MDGWTKLTLPSNKEFGMGCLADGYFWEKGCCMLTLQGEREERSFKDIYYNNRVETKKADI